MKKKNPSEKVNLATIATHLGLSISTVSRALRDERGINAATRARVFETAQAIGYLKGAPFIGGHRNRTLNILALGQSSSAMFDLRYMAGMSSAAVNLNISILSHHLASGDLDSILDPARQPVLMRQGEVDGIVLMHHWPEPIARELSAHFPVVSIVHSYPDLPIDTVGTDDRQGMMTIVRHLHASGYKNIGFFGLCPEVSWSRSRFAGFVEAMVTLGLHFSIDRVIPISTLEALAARPFPETEWANSLSTVEKSGTTAWVASSIMTGLTLHRFFSKRGLAIPRDVAITGFHRQAPQSSDGPLLTSVDVTDEELGAAALRRLIHRIKNPAESKRSILLPVTFHQGDSSPSYPQKNSSEIVPLHSSARQSRRGNHPIKTANDDLSEATPPSKAETTRNH